MRTKLTNYERIVDKLDAPIRDIEIKACWFGLKKSDLSYSDKIEYIQNHWNVSKETVEKAIYSK